MAYTYSAGSALQVVHNNVTVNTAYGSTAYTYVDIPGTSITLTTKGTGSLIHLQCYVNGWGSGGNGVNIAFKLNGVVAGNSSSSNGDTWCRAINGGTAGRSWNVGRSMLWQHGLSLGSTATISLVMGTWSVAGVSAGWSSYQTYFHVTATELASS
jgi:hypothetical protein